MTFAFFVFSRSALLILLIPLIANKNDYISQVPYAYWPKVHRDYKKDTHNPLFYLTSDAAFAQSFTQTVTPKKYYKKNYTWCPASGGLIKTVVS
jgi:hypothetical protein